MRSERSPLPTCSLRDCGLYAVLLLLLGGQQPCLQQRHGARAILVLRAFVLAFDHQAGGQMRDADGRVGLVDVLAARAGGAKGVDAQIGRIDLDVVDLVELGQYGHGAGRGMDTALRFGLRHALHAVRTGFEFEGRERAAADHAADHFLVAAVLAQALAEDFDLPAATFGVARVHAMQISGEDGGLVATRAGTYFQIDVALVARILRQQAAATDPRSRCSSRAVQPRLFLLPISRMAGSESAANSRAATCCVSSSA